MKENGFKQKRKAIRRRYHAEPINYADYADDLLLHANTPAQAEYRLHSSVPYSQLTLCAIWTYNVHYYRTYKEHRNLGIRKHVTTSCSGTKPFY